VTSSSLSELTERVVSPEELRRALEDPIPPDEREEVVALQRWFTTRYPTAEARLAYVRQAYARWRAVATRR
jgi:hypothetical protein